MTIEERKIALVEMDRQIIDGGDELVMMTWFSIGLPDCYEEDDIDFICEDDENWEDVYKVYTSCMKRLHISPLY